MRVLRRLGRILALLLAGLLPPLAAHAAIFDDGNDRKLLFDLRLKPESQLTDDERMILRAADSYGNVGFCSKAGGNATMIDYFGRPAIVTSSHMFIDPKTGKQLCSDAELRGATFMPNITYHDDRSQFPESLTHRRVKLVLPGVNQQVDRRRLGAGFSPNEDQIIFYLEEDITTDMMPGGHARGALKVASIGQNGIASQYTGSLTMIGIAPDVRNGLATLYQTCRVKLMMYAGLSHDCDAISGASGSALMVKQGNELRIVGLHMGSFQGNEVVSATDDPLEWNFATVLPDVDGRGLSDRMKALYVEPFRDPAFIPYQLQFLLHRAGDYTGKLDNKWGPGSRKALDAFVARTGACLPGRDPSMELWDALEAAMQDPRAGCTPEPTTDGVADLGAMLDAVCIAGRLEPRTIGSLLETWTRDNAFELVKHYPPKDTDATRQESWDMKKGDRAFAAAFMEIAEESGPKKACRVMGFDLDPAGVRDHVAARYGFGQAATDDEDETLVASWTTALDGYADAMTIRIRKIGPVVDVWFRE